MDMFFFPSISAFKLRQFYSQNWENFAIFIRKYKRIKQFETFPITLQRFPPYSFKKTLSYTQMAIKCFIYGILII